MSVQYKLELNTNMKINKAKGAFIALSSLIAFGSANVSAQQVTDIEIRQIWTGGYSDGSSAAVRIFTAANTFSGCNRTDAFVITSGNTSPDSNGAVRLQNIYFEQQFSQLLAAQHAGDSVTVFISGCTSDGNWPRAIRVTSGE